MPKYAVVMVPIAVKALVRIETVDSTLEFPPETCTTPHMAAIAIATSPKKITHIPVQARVWSTAKELAGSAL
jgi:hypothetical protein